MEIERKEIEAYLSEVQEAIRKDQYRIAQNEKRQGNRSLFLNYVIDEAGAKNILLNLTPDDFSGVVRNHHVGFEHERLYIFGKNVRLLERFGNDEKEVSLYIKFNKLENCFVIVISFHEQEYPLRYHSWES